MAIQEYGKVLIEGVLPQIDGGTYPIKRVLGDTITVSADVYKEGHDKLVALLKYRLRGADTWQEVPMSAGHNDRWTGSFKVDTIGKYEYTIEAYAERYLSWLDELGKKNRPGANLTSELREGLAIIANAIGLADAEDRALLQTITTELEKSIIAGNQAGAIEFATLSKTKQLMAKYPDRTENGEYQPYLGVTVNRVAARYAAWYELFPRSQGQLPGVSGTFKDCEARLPDIHAMGFDVIYFPPIHPIGITNRKGPNNSLTAGPNDPGCPYAIGNHLGGHDALEPGLGDFADFESFRQAAAKLGIEIAMDFVMNCSPDHPYVTEHPDWFYHRPDGSIKYAENPPKKYEDVYPLNFNTADREGLWNEMRRVLLFWADKGVKTVRVDNPHTKPVPFWEWVIAEVQAVHPDIIFLSEAFTRPKMMKMLSKVGFTQSYTYFTWRNSKDELIEYFTELTTTEMSEYFTGNMFVNTPDILPVILQIGGRPAFIMRAVLAATMASVYGVYSGFELCENEAIPGKEEYYNSEKYDFKVRDWNAPGNIKAIITRLNKIRRENSALHDYTNLRFVHTENPNVLGYYKMNATGTNIIVTVVNLDPFHRQDTFIDLPLEQFGIGHNDLYQVHDLLNDEHYLWRGVRNFVLLEPNVKQAHVFRIRKWSHYENGFDYFQ